MSDTIDRQVAIQKLIEFIARTNMSDLYPGIYQAVQLVIDELPSVQPEIIRCKDCRYSEYDFIFHSRYCHNKGKAELVGDNFFCAAGRYQTNGSD